LAYIYKITNKVNSKFYIGSTKDYARRKKEHISQLTKKKHTNGSLQTDWNKYKAKNFIFSIVEEIPNDLQFITEQKYLDELVGIVDQIYNKSRNAIGSPESFRVIHRPCCICGELFSTFSYGQTTCSHECGARYMELVKRESRDESWKYSNYEYKDISDWDVDDHMASDYDDRMSK